MSRARTLANTVSTGSAVSATANDLSGGVTGSIPYQAGVGDTSMLSPGTSGQVLTTQGSGSPPAWGNVSSAFDTSAFSFTNYSTVNYNSAGSLVQYAVSLVAIVPLSTTHLLFLAVTGSPQTLGGIVYDIAGDTFGSWTLIRTYPGSNSTARASAISSSQVLVCSLSLNSTALETVVLSISGTTLTVNTAVATTLSSAASFVSSPNSSLIEVGGSYVVGYYRSAVGSGFVRAITVSGTTPTIGSEASTAASVSNQALFPYSSTHFILIASNPSAVFQVHEVTGGTTITKTSDTTLIASDVASIMTIGRFSSGRIACTASTSTTAYGYVVSIAAGVATFSTCTLVPSIPNSPPARLDIIGNQAICAFGNSFSLLTDNAGSAVASTNPVNFISSTIFGLDTSTNRLILPGASNRIGCSLGISGNELVVVAKYPFISGITNTYTPQVGSLTSTQFQYALSRDFNRAELITASGKMASLSAFNNPYAATYKDGVGFTPTFNTQGLTTVRADPLNFAVGWTTTPQTNQEWNIQKVTLL